MEGFVNNMVRSLKNVKRDSPVGGAVAGLKEIGVEVTGGALEMEDDNESPDDVTLAVGKIEALERGRNEAEAVKRWEPLFILAELLTHCPLFSFFLQILESVIYSTVVWRSQTLYQTAMRGGWVGCSWSSCLAITYAIIQIDSLSSGCTGI